ncbi:MAG: hypothetical protein HY286_05665 [Planctomycetes bacterium]|nr:hypothetical protein [Planctomycetota bacterium]
MNREPNERSIARGGGIAAAAILCALGALPSCGSIFRSYPTQIAPVYSAYRAGDFAQAAAMIRSDDYQSKKEGRDGVVWLLEEGKLLHAAKRFADSNVTFTICEQKIEEMEKRPAVSLRDGLDEAAAVGTNTNAIPYKANPAEKILINTYKALNYLATGDLEGALVEVRRADLAQKDAVEKYASEIAAAQEDARSTARAKNLHYSGVASNGGNRSKIDNLYSNLNDQLTPEYANFTNPFASYISAACHVANFDADDARVDFARLAAIAPGNPSVAADLESIDRSGVRALDRSVFVFFENGAGPRRAETRIDLVVPVPGYITYIGFAFPTLQFSPADARTLAVQGGDGRALGQTLRIASVDAIVANEFHQQLPSMIARIIVSTLAKAVVSNVNKRHGDLADTLTRIAVGIWSAIVNNADLRGWTTLGKEFQVARFPIPADRKLQFALEFTNGRRGSPIVVDIPDGDCAFVIARSVHPGHLSLHASSVRRRIGA